MQSYFTCLMQDVVDSGFTTAKGAHAVVLSHIEEGRASWNNLETINAIRRAFTQKSYSNNSYASGKNNIKATNIKQGNKVKPCTGFQNGSCTLESMHVKEGVSLKHICVHCFTTLGKQFNHPSSACYKLVSSQGGQLNMT